MKTMLHKQLVVVFLILAWIAGPAAAAQAQTGMSPKAFERDHQADMQAVKTGKVFVMTGKITAVDPQYQTVVIDCPRSGGAFTVGGPLAAKAQLRRGGKTARLGDFSAGDPVSVKWKATPNGHLILTLNGK